MRVGLLGKKLGMTQVFDEHGHGVAATVLEVGPCCITGIRTHEKDGYEAIQLGLGRMKEHNASKPRKGQSGLSEAVVPRHIREIRTSMLEGAKVGSEVRVSLFKPKDIVDISGVGIGLGFQGVVKRHNFSGGGGHGAKFGRETGSTGQCATPARVLKGKRMAGHAGNRKVTQQNIEVLSILEDENLMIVRGSVPGPENELLIIRTAVKQGLPSKSWVVQSKGKTEVQPESKGEKKQKATEKPVTEAIDVAGTDEKSKESKTKKPPIKQGPKTEKAAKQPKDEESAKGTVDAKSEPGKKDAAEGKPAS